MPALCKVFFCDLCDFLLAAFAVRLFGGAGQLKPVTAKDAKESRKGLLLCTLSTEIHEGSC